MQTLEVKVNDCEVEEDGCEADHGEPGCSLTVPASGCGCMEVGSVDSPDDEGPNFFGVPTPEPVPSLICPDCSRNQCEGPEDKTNDVELVRLAF